MNDMVLSETWSTEEASMHINCLELKAIIYALQAWIPYVQGRQVMVTMDNTSMVSCINNQGGTHPLPASAHPGVTPLVTDSKGFTPGTLHSWSVQCDSGLAIPQPPGSAIQMATPSDGVILGVQ
jgi:hypothetical protein